MPRLTFTTRVSRLVHLHPKSRPVEGREKRGFSGRVRWAGGKGQPRRLPGLVGAEKPYGGQSSVVGTLARFQQAHGWARVPGTARLWFAGSKGRCPLGRIPKGGTPLRRGFRGENPCRAVAARSEAGILRDGFGVPLARNIACDV